MERCKKCCFCDADESVEHLFLACPFAKIVWRIVFSTYNIPPPTNIKNMFGNWLNGIEKKNQRPNTNWSVPFVLVYLEEPE
jgi:fructose-specific phosphotransferase system IIC component